jgi:hypothetical protein
MMKVRARSAERLEKDEEVLKITSDYDELFKIATGFEDSLKELTGGIEVDDFTNELNEKMLRLELSGKDVEELLKWGDLMPNKWADMRNLVNEAVQEAKGKQKKKR